MTIRVIVNGADGKMGHETVKTIERDDELELVAATGRKDDLAAVIAKTQAEVVVDFTTASAGFINASIIIGAGAHPVIGTSGFLPDQIQELQKRCAKKNLGGIIAPNFSVGAVLMMRFAQQAAQYYSHAEIIEMHHIGKEDSPSGTSIRTAQLIAQARKELSPIRKTRETVPGARGANYEEIPIHSIRLPGLVAHQAIMFGGRGETLTLRHDSLHRESFMPGVRMACRKVLTLDHLVYGLENILE